MPSPLLKSCPRLCGAVHVYVPNTLSACVVPVSSALTDTLKCHETNQDRTFPLLFFQNCDIPSFMIKAPNDRVSLLHPIYMFYVVPYIHLLFLCPSHDPLHYYEMNVPHLCSRIYPTPLSHLPLVNVPFDVDLILWTHPSKYVRHLLTLGTHMSIFMFSFSKLSRMRWTFYQETMRRIESYFSVADSFLTSSFILLKNVSILLCFKFIDYISAVEVCT